jgi:hypothetical protein
MIQAAKGHVTVLADLVDPTDDGILIQLVNYGIKALMVAAVILAGWHAVKEWKGKKGDEALKVLREHAYALLGVEAFLGAVILIANRGTDLIPGLGI